MTTPTFTPAVGEVIVVKAQGSHGDGTNFAGPTDSGSVIFFTQRQLDDALSRDRIGLWTAVVSDSAAGISNNISLTAPAAGTGTNGRSMVVERWANARLAATPATALTSVAGTAPSTTLTTVGVNSVVSWVNTDWNAVDGASRAYRTTSAVPVEEGYDFIAADHTGEFAYQVAVAPGSQTLGLTAPGAENWSLASIEILDNPPIGFRTRHLWPGKGPFRPKRFRITRIHDDLPVTAAAPVIYVPDWILQHSDGRRRISITRRGEFFWPGQNFPPCPWVPPIIQQPQARNRFPNIRRGRFFFTSPPVVAAVVTVPPQFLTRRRQSLGPARRGRFFSTGPTISVPPKLLTQRRQSLRVPRRGVIFPVVSVVVTAPTAVWEPNLIAPAQRRLMLRPRRGQFLFPGQNFPPGVWEPNLIQQAQQHRTLMIRRGRFFPFPLAVTAAPVVTVPPQFLTRRRQSFVAQRRGHFFPAVPVVVAVVVTTPPSFMTRRRQPLMAQRRGRFFERLIPPAVCPTMIARKRAGLPPSRRGRYFWHGQNFPAMPPIVHRIRRVYRPGLPQARFRNRFYGPWWIVIAPPSEVWATGRVVQGGVAGSGSTSGPTGSVDPSGTAGHGNIGDSEHGKVTEEHVEGSVKLH